MLGSKTKEPTVREIFESMSLSSAVHINNTAMAKQKEYANGSAFIDGKLIHEENIKWDALSSLLVESSMKGFKTWSSFDAFSRSKILLRISQAIEKNQQLLTSLEAFNSGKHVHKVKTKDIVNLIESFDYYAGCALQLSDESIAESLHPIGPVCVIAEEFNSLSTALSLRVSSLLATGNSVVLLTPLEQSAFELFLTEICTESGLPDGVLNVVPVDQKKFDMGKLSSFSKVICTGSYEKGLSIAKLCSKVVLPLDILIPKRPLVIVYENADLHSAANSVLEAFFSHDTRSKSGGCKVFIQESISKKFLEILKRRFKNILVGENITNTDISCSVTEEQKEILAECIKDAKNKAECFCVETTQENINQDTYPVLINGLQTSCKLVHEELGGPVIVTVPFRTVKESISMYNCDNRGSPVSIWSEKISVALEVALKLKSGVIWVNSENVIDAKTAFSGIYGSGNSSEGGKDAFFSHLTALPESLLRYKSNASDQEEKYEAWIKENKRPALTNQICSEEMHEYQLYINGIQKQSDNGTLPLDKSTLVPAGTEGDVQSAISSAVAAQTKWESVSDSQRRKILRSVASKLVEYREGYISELQRISENSLDECEKEFNDTIDFLHYWSSQNEKLSGSMQEIKNNCIVMQNRNALGVIGIQCPNEKPLLSFVSLVIPAIAFGNTAVVLASPKYPTLALKMSEIFTLSNIPGGVINVISGDLSRLVPVLCKHNDVNAIWYTDAPMKALLSSLECNLVQRKFCCQGIWGAFSHVKCLKFLMESTYNKTIFLPAGEIFAN